MGVKKGVCIALATMTAFSQAVTASAADSTFDGADGSELAKEYISEVIDYINDNYIGGDISTQELVEAAINGMAHALDDYSEYYTQDEYDELIKSISGKLYTTGIDFELSNEGYPVVTAIQDGSSAATQDIKVGDKITAVDGVSTGGKGVREIQNMLTSATADTLQLRLWRSGRELEVRCTLREKKVKTVEVVDIGTKITLNPKYKNDEIAYIKINQIADNTDSEIRQAITALKKQGKTKLVLDLRGNTGGYVEQAIGVCRQLVPSGRIIYAKDKAGNVTEYNSYLTQKPFDNMVVLVDDMTASASEIVASAIQDSGAGIVIGKQTYGKGVMQSVIDLSDMGYLKLTAYEYFSRTGKKINGVGVTPDIPIEDVLFVSEEDSISSSKVRTALELMGYSTLTESKIKRSIGSFQRKEGLPVTYKLDSATVNAINVKVYTMTKDTDRALVEAYVNLTGRVSDENKK
jgi:carboxyl-terminal processing protease